jgi:transposase-like protein
MLTEFKNLSELMVAFAKPQAAIDYFAAIRWRDGKFCPYCGSTNVYDTIKAKKTAYRCRDCRNSYSVTVGTVFEDSKLPLRIWFGAIWMLVNHPKGIASTTLAKDLGIRQASAWFVLHRLRYVARTRSFDKPLSGIVEIDEAFVKGLPNKGRKNKNIAIVGAAERKGRVVARVVPSGLNWPQAKKFIQDTVAHDAKGLITDAHRIFTYGIPGYPQHQTINHVKEGHTRGDVHTQTIEGVWAQLKRQIYGIHHWVSPKHLQNYVNEMAWRMSRREMTANERIAALCERSDGRLKYKDLTA